MGSLPRGSSRSWRAGSDQLPKPPSLFVLKFVHALHRIWSPFAIVIRHSSHSKSAMIPVGQSPISPASSELRSEPERPGISERHGARGGPKSSGMSSAGARSADSDPINAMSVDVEDYFQVSAFERHIDRDAWDSIPRRVESNVDRILQLFDDFGVKATFFTLGWIAERHPTMVKRIVGAGHELASHGYSHVRVTELDPAAFRRDVTTTKGLLGGPRGCGCPGVSGSELLDRGEQPVGVAHPGRDGARLLFEHLPDSARSIRHAECGSVSLRAR
jgi:hypothetical protein